MNIVIVIVICLCMLFSLSFALRSSSSNILRSNSRLMASVGASLPKGIYDLQFIIFTIIITVIINI